MNIREKYSLSIYVGLCALLGGASAGGFLANALLQIIGLLLIFRNFSALSEKLRANPEVYRALCALLTVLITWFVVQLIPLPPELWTQMPGRTRIAEGMSLLDSNLDWHPIALEPERSLYSIFAFIPAFATLLLVLKANRDAIARCIITLAIFGWLSIFVGFIQISTNGETIFQLYTKGPMAYATGLFANSNHLSTFLCATAALLIFFNGLRQAIQRGGKSSPITKTLSHFTISAFLFASAVGGSMAGAMLATVCGAYYLVTLFERFATRKSFFLLLIALVGLVLVAGLIATKFYASGLERLAEATGADTRIYLWQTTWLAIRETFPLGIGLGNFRWYIPAFEDPDIVLSNYPNHAHNDWLEFVLEGGLISLAIIASLMWLLIQAFRQSLKDGSLTFVQSVAPFVVILMIALHSLVDYPLRTAAIAACAAIAFALAIAGPGKDQKNERPDRSM
jgi:O-antigen ligase